MQPTVRTDAPSTKPPAPLRAMYRQSRAERLRERRAQLKRERLVAAWLRSLSNR